MLGLPGSALLRAAEAAGLRTVREFFVDRGYTPEATLVPRSQPGALLHDPEEVTARVLRMIESGVVHGRGRHATCGWMRSRRACTATPPGRWRWPRRSERAWTARASR